MTRSEFIKFLSAFDLTIKRIETLLELMDDDYQFEKLYKMNLSKIVGDVLANKIIENADDEFFEEYLEELNRKQITLITKEDKEYPEKLLRVEDAPYCLFCKGNLDLLRRPAIAIVGSRSPSNYGKIVTEKFAEKLSQAGVVVISGLAYGVDGIAHRKTLDSYGDTIAVLGSGFDHVYPAVHTNMAEEIAECGLLISEYRPDVQATRFSFPMRNRIVAGLSDGVLITEASAKSGTLITKDCALDSGIAIYAVPGNITSEKSQGTNEIIASLQGNCVLSPDDILRDLGINGKEKKKKSVQLSIEETKIVELLSSGEKHIEFLSENVDFDIKTLNSLLTTLEIKSIIKRMPGDFYALG